MNFKLPVLIMLAACMLAPVVSYADNENVPRTTGQYIDDNLIAGQVKGTILGDAGMKGFDVNVTVYKGNVQLSGFVDNQEAKDRAGELAQSVNGVKVVTNNLMIKQ